MPYIKQNERDRFNVAIEEINCFLCHPGELNYIITRLMHGYVNMNGVKYETLNAVIGALESAKAEFQRKIVAPYEDIKIKENGNV